MYYFFGVDPGIKNFGLVLVAGNKLNGYTTVTRRTIDLGKQAEDVTVVLRRLFDSFDYNIQPEDQVVIAYELNHFKKDAHISSLFNQLVGLFIGQVFRLTKQVRIYPVSPLGLDQKLGFEDSKQKKIICNSIYIRMKATKVLTDPGETIPTFHETDAFLNILIACYHSQKQTPEREFIEHFCGFYNNGWKFPLVRYSEAHIKPSKYHHTRRSRRDVGRVLDPKQNKGHHPNNALLDVRQPELDSPQKSICCPWSAVVEHRKPSGMSQSTDSDHS